MRRPLRPERHTRGGLQGRQAPGKRITVEGVSVFTIGDGKITETRTVVDMLGIMQQLGALPAS